MDLLQRQLGLHSENLSLHRLKRPKTNPRNIEFIESEKTPRPDIDMSLKFLTKRKEDNSSIREIVKFWLLTTLSSRTLKKISKISLILLKENSSDKTNKRKV